jgi:hypothetical protein
MLLPAYTKMVMNRQRYDTVKYYSIALDVHVQNLHKIYKTRKQIHTIFMYEAHLESKERSRIQPAQLFQCS